MRTISSITKKTNLSSQELASIFKQGAILRLPYLNSRLLLAKENIRNYEQKYKNTFKHFKINGLPEDAGYEMHEDFIEWEYWEDVLSENEKTVKHVKEFLKELEEG